jgi:hypothetical protein
LYFKGKFSKIYLVERVILWSHLPLFLSAKIKIFFFYKNIFKIKAAFLNPTTKTFGCKFFLMPSLLIFTKKIFTIKTFLKYIGPEDIEVGEKYQEHLNSMGIKTHICKDSKTTEYAKLLDTTYYGICIAFHADVARICENEQIDFDEVMTLFNQTYNQGYTELGKNNVVRPVLYQTKKIGGHCVVPNAKILKDYMNTKTVQSILDYE